jgi:hypothetical protein
VTAAHPSGARWLVRDRVAITAETILSDGFERGSAAAWSSTEPER